MAQGNNKVAASKDDKSKNTLAVPNVRLPLGHSATDASGGTATMFHFLIPTNAGGDLVLTNEGGEEMTLYRSDGTTVVKGPTKLSKIEMHVPPSTAEKPTHGRYYLLVKGPSPRKVSCTFKQNGVAREGTSDKDPPLLPWNFYSWPSAQSFVDNTGKSTVNPMIAVQDQVLKDYAKAFSHDAAKGIAFENLNHRAATGAEWFGHCHMASRSTILFERPVPVTVPVPGKPDEKVHFSEEALWFLAAEWCAGWTQRKNVYDDRNFPRPFAKYRDVDDNGNERTAPKKLNELFWSDLIKPAHCDLKPQDLAAEIKKAIPLYDPTTPAELVDKLAKYAAKTNPETLKILFGQRAAFFYAALIEGIYLKKHALAGDLRGEGADNAAVEVWNHAVFYFEASLKEVLPLDEKGQQDPSSLENEDLLEVTLTVVANEDYDQLPSMRSSENEEDKKARPPAIAEVDGSINTSSSRVENRKSRHVLHVAFDSSSGNVDVPTLELSMAELTWSTPDPKAATKTKHKRSDAVLDDRARWMKCRSDFADIYIPRYLCEMQPAANKAPPATRALSVPGDMGNTMVELDIAAPPAQLLKIRKRYAK